MVGCGEDTDSCVAELLEPCPTTMNIRYVCGCDGETYVNLNGRVPSDLQLHRGGVRVGCDCSSLLWRASLLSCAVHAQQRTFFFNFGAQFKPRFAADEHYGRCRWRVVVTQNDSAV